MNKPNFLSEVEIKQKPRIRFLSLPGQDDPLLTFDEKTDSIISYLKEEKDDIVGNIFGIYYVDRREKGVENVKWDACIPIEDEFQVKKPFMYKELAPCKVSSIVLTGGYELIGDAIKWMEYRLREMNINTEWPLIEIYIKEGDTPITELQYTVVS
jgi:DNA gyrase inhibitor GyrI